MLRVRTLLAVALVAAPAVVHAVAPHVAATTARADGAGPFHVERSESNTVRVHHAAGVTDVPAAVERVCALAFADELLCLGITPVAVPCDADGEPVDYLQQRLHGVAQVHTMPGTGVPDMRAVQASRPDLIVTAAIDTRVVDQLERIAPTVVLRAATAMYRENGSIEAIEQRLRDLAAVLGRDAAAERFLTRFHDRLAELRARLATSITGRSIAFLRTRGRVWRLYGHRGSFGGEAVFTALGLGGPPDVRDDGITALDPEGLLGFDCDNLIVVADPTPGAAQGLARLRRHPLWQRISAVQQHRVHEVTTYRHWVLSGPLGKLQMAEDIVACVLP